ncbi:GntR family transcriptional regulator [Falsochrobactrum sp. TDYN1]|uniref:GntR family transcriptional regulator n=1 Tax=Falsochrobactrum tianjinense TaxID=2706015 RepID=A0A949PLX8_9HYPH|nr:GntR family transcriptional regulator [Falsochrobactrum sp. TDYN1]MBV2143483.1 GntR family transcriptional regulator [Falsochrobactrum sp. TDYN1]
MPTTKPLNRANLSEQLYEDLRRRLMDGHFKPGQRLVIAAFAEQYGTSITPVREAIFRLASERALEVRAATSIVVPKLTSQDLREIISIRVELEGIAAYRVAEIVTAEQIEEFQALNDSFNKAAKSDPELASRINRDFHFRILKLAGMPYIESICENMWMLMGPFLRTFHEEVPVRQLTGKDHKHLDFIGALKARDPLAAKRAMQDDVRWSYALVAVQEKAEAATSPV